MGGAGTGDDTELIRLAKGGDQEAFGRLVIRHQDWVHNLLWRKTGDEGLAADLTQNVFLNIWQAIGRYDGRAKFTTWLYRVALNEAVSSHRKSSAGKRGGGARLVSLDADNAPDPVGTSAQGYGSPDSGIEADEIRDRIFEAIRSLDEESQQVVLLRELEGLSYEEIADVLEMNPGTVRSKLSRARDKLREKLQDLIK